MARVSAPWPMTLIIGLISGTSVDGIDAALVDITHPPHGLVAHLIAGQTYPYPPALREQILAVCDGAAIALTDLADLDDAIATCFAQAALAIQTGHPAATCIGSHGQTVFHRPRPLDRPNALGYSLQLGRGVLIAHLTGITTISDFRLADIAAGGQGAPLVPPVDAALLTHPTYDRCVQNLGGIGNVTYLPAQSHPAPEAKILGWDTGPSNSLLDLAVQRFSNGAQSYDRDGAWAASGTICQPLVDTWLQQDYFQQPPPKSTGRELFGVEYLECCLAAAEPWHLSSADILATLTELTVAAIAQSYRTFLPRLPQQVLLCGGGSKNTFLRQRLQTRLSEVSVITTDAAGLNADFKEAIAFAVLAYWRQQGIAGNLPSVTGAQQPMILGEIHPAMPKRA